MPRLSDFRALSFDCYGTLIDWETGLWEAAQPLVAGIGVTRREVLTEFARLEAEVEAGDPRLRYPEVLARVHHRMAESLGGVTTEEMDRAFGASVGAWPAFPDTPAALGFLKTRYRLVILSNVDRASFAESNWRLGVEFDAVYTAEDIGSYKPDPANFDYLIAHVQSDLGIEAHELLHTAQSLYHDHLPARAAGLATAWIDRQRLAEGGDWGATAAAAGIPQVDFRYHSLAEMAEAVSAAT
jgi:2-haloacid dehalogenase